MHEAENSDQNMGLSVGNDNMSNDATGTTQTLSLLLDS